MDTEDNILDDGPEIYDSSAGKKEVNQVRVSCIYLVLMLLVGSLIVKLLSPVELTYVQMVIGAIGYVLFASSIVLLQEFIKFLWFLFIFSG